MDKSVVRRAALRRRDGLNQDARQRWNTDILRLLQDFIESNPKALNNASRRPMVALYRAIGSEVDVWPIASQLWEQGWHTCVPVTHVAERVLSFHEVDKHSTWVSGAMGILEPELRGRPVESGEIGLYLVPGAGFTKGGGRVGYGGGYYDRWMGQAPDAGLRVGVAFECQIIPTIPVEPHDIRMHALITEAGVTMCGL